MVHQSCALLWRERGFDAAGLFVKLCYAVLFVIVLAIIMWFAERALKSPWGRMMRAIRDNRDAAAAMGKDVKRRHLQTFVLAVRCVRDCWCDADHA